MDSELEIFASRALHIEIFSSRALNLPSHRPVYRFDQILSQILRIAESNYPTNGARTSSSSAHCNNAICR